MTTQTVGAAYEPVGESMLDQDVRRLQPRAPRFQREVIERTRLLATLADGRAQRVVRISAPAGFGKTILAAQLSHREPRPSARMALSRSDNDPVALLNDVVQVLVQLGSLAPRIRRELHSSDVSIHGGALALLGAELAGATPFVLVLDDVELVNSQASQAVLSFLVDHVPPGSQVVLVTRAGGDIPLARMRAAGEVLDIRAADLALDASETRELLAGGGLHLSDDQAEEVRDRAEGWAAGIALALLPAGRRPAGRDLPGAIGASSDVAAYLIEEALESQSPEVQRFLLASSVLRRISAGLCDAALEITNSRQILATLLHESLFVVPLGGDGDWYRYHGLFRELLQTELRRRSPEVVGAVIRRAAAWHEQRGDAHDAFEYAHASGDLARAGRIILRAGQKLIAEGQIETVRAWLECCTPEELGSDGQLALAGAWVALLSGEAAETRRLSAVAHSAADLESPSPDGATSLRSSLTNLRAMLAADGVTKMLSDAENVVAAERAAGTRWVMDGWRGVGTAHLLAGHTDHAIAAFAEALSLSRDRPDLSSITINCLGYSALAAGDTGDWRRARKWAREAHALTTESGLQHVVHGVVPYTAHATVLLHDGLLPQARKALQHVLHRLPMVHALRWWEADICLRCADMSLDLGDATGALELADTARAALNSYPDAGALPFRLTVLDARLRSGGNLHLTPSELRLSPFLSSHLSLQEIGDRIYLSRATVKTHTDSIYRKLGVSSRSAAVERLEDLGLSR